jgi:hypothetical protein
MNARVASLLALCLGLAGPGAALARPGSPIWTDPRGDNLIRRTGGDPNAALNPAGRTPDLLRVSLTAWQSPTPSFDPYTGAPADPETAHLFRLEVVFDGLVNPPGPLDGPFDPFRFGPSPVYGFLDIDVDANRDTGGELLPAAAHRYLANVGRFGQVPRGPQHERVLDWGKRILTHQFGQDPKFERSGADFSLVLCGCRAPEIFLEGGNGNHLFEAGETWVMRSDFFQRAGGYQGACLSYGGLSNTPGMYDPPVHLRFSHNTIANQTTLTLVYALDNIGAGLLAGQPPEMEDFDAGNQSSVREALLDLIFGIENNIPTGPALEFCRDFCPGNLQEDLDPTGWRISALFGTSYLQQQPDALYVWTDTGLEECAGDLNGDGVAGPLDLAALRDAIVSYDATSFDAEGTRFENGAVRVGDFPRNFCLFDISGDGWVDERDTWYYCLADFNADGHVNVNDLTGFLTGFSNSNPRADIDRNGRFDINDFIGFNSAFAAGCP